MTIEPTLIILGLIILLGTILAFSWIRKKWGQLDPGTGAIGDALFLAIALIFNVAFVIIGAILFIKGLF